ncbi:MAG: hypothetical protein AABM30_09300 [Actinomycetota bacterium]
MRYMIYDNEGNALGSFRSRIAAEASLRAMAAADSDTGDDLVMMLYRDDGTFTGRALTADDIGPPVRIAPTVWIANIAWAASGGRRAARPNFNRYATLILAGRKQAEPLVRQPQHDLERESAAAPRA